MTEASPRVVVTGATGYIGRHLIKALRAAGFAETRMVRRGQQPGDATWDVTTGKVQVAAFEDAAAVIHLAGENTVTKGWYPGGRRAVRESRLKGTRLLAETLAALTPHPPVLISASAVGYYGHHHHDPVTEASSSGSGWLASVCRDWEAATLPAQQAGIRVVRMRIGPVLSADGGMLGAMLPLFRAGLGARIGSGHQWMSWISMVDLMGAFVFALQNAGVSGPVNATSPHPVTNQEFTDTLARLVGKRARLTVPGFAVRGALGPLGQQMLLEGARVMPAQLEGAGFEFRYPNLKQALEAAIAQGG